MPTRIALDQTPAPSRLSSSPRSNNHNHTHGFLASRWVEEEKQEEKADNNLSPMDGGGDDEGSLTINGERLQQTGGRRRALGAAVMIQKQPIDNGTKRPRARRGLKHQQSSCSLSDIMDNEHTVTSTPNTRNSRRATSMSGFRSSILRELSVRQDYNDAAQTGTGGTQQQRDDDDVQRMKLDGHENRKSLAPQDRLSSDDIRASPRFLGYLFCMIASAVLLVSVIQ
jgi:hypothetical protein